MRTSSSTINAPRSPASSCDASCEWYHPVPAGPATNRYRNTFGGAESELAEDCTCGKANRMAVPHEVASCGMGRVGCKGDGSQPDV
jgi:hypothetical protein